MILIKCKVCKNTTLTKYKFAKAQYWQNMFAKMQSCKTQLCKNVWWNGPFGVPYLLSTHDMLPWPLVNNTKSSILLIVAENIIWNSKITCMTFIWLMQMCSHLISKVINRASYSMPSCIMPVVCTINVVSPYSCSSLLYTPFLRA